MTHADWYPLPASLAPMLAAPGSPPRGRLAEWALEMKWDGVRALAFVSDGRLRLVSRTGKDITATYPELGSPAGPGGLAGLVGASGREQLLLDGEIVAFADGRPDFEALQPRMHVSSPEAAMRLAGLIPVSYLAFDVLQLDGRPLLALPYLERREILTTIIPNGPGRLSPPHFPGTDLDAVRAASVANGLEGVVAKRLDSPYEPGVRSGSWLKLKNVLRQEVVVAGWKPGKGNRTGLIGSLLVGVYSDGGQLLYAGHVGTGFSDETLRMLTRLVAPLRRPGSPFDGPVPAEYSRPAVWVEPRLVVEVTFDRWTRAGRMRAPAYQGLRDDKDPVDVVREAQLSSGGADFPHGGPAPHPPAPVPPGACPMKGKDIGHADEILEARMPADDKITVLVEGRELTLTNLTKVLYPEDGFTKAEVLDYYQRISPVLLPHIAGRPMTLRRYPHGVADLSFFAKHAPDHRPDWLHTREVVSHSSRARTPGAAVRYLVIDDLPALIWAVNLAAIELHVPMWRFPASDGAGGDSSGAEPEPMPEAGNDPDLLVFDLDPGAPATIVECCRVAEALLPALEAAGLRPLAKTSGGKGLQLYATVSGLTAEQASDMALGFAQRLERELPSLVVSRMTRSARTGKVFIDWSQNNGSKTTVAPYSLRAREHPTVSTPVTWDEVAACRQVADLVFTAPDVLARVEAHGDLFAPLTPRDS